MAKIVYAEFIDHISGKRCRKSANGGIYMHRKFDSANFISHRDSAPVCYDDLTEPQKLQCQIFKAVQALVKTASEDGTQWEAYTAQWKAQKKFKSVRSLAFSLIYKEKKAEIVASLNQSN